MLIKIKIDLCSRWYFHYCLQYFKCKLDNGRSLRQVNTKGTKQGMFACDPMDVSLN